ncbi:putative receptor-like protein EIX2 [Cocos nucifera]|uniref:Putative receptor-like protein EIX2 n=1 Tax=Cocos nucifera TaxID=13894 RepID=A0A8K0HX74_COCNU|nr:putative receptor-like protein EIX2 [Cocos nucifera]
MPVTFATKRSSKPFVVSKEILESKTMLRSTLWFLLWLVSYQTTVSSSCLELERMALLAFKASLNNTRIRLASWQGLDCCTWNGVGCNNAVKLNLRNPYNSMHESKQVGFGWIHTPIIWQFQCHGFNIAGIYKKLSVLEFWKLWPLRLQREFTDNYEGRRTGIFHHPMDLSSDSLSGEIPEGIGDLLALKNLNLSRNHLNPNSIGGLKSVESPDLSMNELSGTIPQSISTLTSLSRLNLSYNKLSGRIPTGYQLQTLEDPSIYVGNLDLCGPPISESCSSNETDHGNHEEYEDDGEMLWFYLGMVLGFVVGFWVVFGVLLLKSTWRIAYFRMTDNWFDGLYVGVALTMAKLKKKNMEEN